MSKTILKRKSSPDYVFLGAFCLLVIFGLVMLTSASSNLGKIQFNNSYYYLEHQILYGLLLGIIGFLLTYFIPYTFWQKKSFLLLIINIIFLLLVFSPLGMHIRGAARWLDLKIFSFQPSELLKLTFLLYLATWLSKKKERVKSFWDGFVPFFLLTIFIAFILYIQPATTTALLILGGSLVMYLWSGAKVKYVIGLAIIIIISALIFVLITPYRYSRIIGFLHPNSDLLGTNYQRNQALIAIGSGGLWGVGYGNSTSKINYLPEPIGDSIFAVIAEELGFVGSIGLILLFLVFIIRGLLISKNAPDKFSYLLSIGFIVLIGIQAFINISAISGLLPLTGVPLPFISYGGTSLAVFMTMVGFIAQFSRY
ncbi:MAG: putative lipid II flippase FtsW [Minisyncoccia bacterium]